MSLEELQKLNESEVFELHRNGKITTIQLDEYFQKTPIRQRVLTNNSVWDNLGDSVYCQVTGLDK